MGKQPVWPQFLDRLIAPVARGRFMADHWEQEPLWVSRGKPAWCDPLPSTREMDGILTRTESGDIRIVRADDKAGAETPVIRSGDGKANMVAAYGAYHAGWTIVINGVDQKLPAVGRLAAELTDTLSHRVGVNLYFTPPKARGFAPHADGHDVFVLQLSGRKRWRVYSPVVPFPLEDQEIPVDRRHLGPCRIDATLEPGHVLYMPRGFVHEGVAGSRASLHLTIGIHAIRWIDLVREAAVVQAERDVSLRKSVSLRELEDANSGLNLGAIHPDPEIARVARERILRRAVRASRSAPDGHFEAIDRARSIHLGSIVERRAGLECHVRRQGRRAFLEFGGNRIDGPAGIEEAFRFITAAARFKVGDLPDDLANGSKLLLAERLVLEGLLTIRETNSTRGE